MVRAIPESLMWSSKVFVFVVSALESHAPLNTGNGLVGRKGKLVPLATDSSQELSECVSQKVLVMMLKWDLGVIMM